MTKPIALIDLAAQQATIRADIEKAIIKVLDHGKYIMGPEVQELEAQLAAFTGAKHVISCSNGTDALAMVLMAQGIGPGDAVICPAFTFTATPEVIALLGATPVFCDVDPVSFNIDIDKLPEAIAKARELDLAPKAIIAVDLFGLPADYDGINAVAVEHDMWVLADAAQSFGGEYKGRKVGTLGLATATSFFPAKPLGCYGDGGAVFTDDDEMAAALESIRVHGKGGDKYDNIRIGLNARLDTMQAAILLEKLKIFPQEVVSRNTVAQRYADGLAGIDAIEVPQTSNHSLSVWAQYTLKLKGGQAQRDEVAQKLKAASIPSAIYYPKPLHQQTAYTDCPYPENGLSTSEAMSLSVLSLPMHPYLEAEEQERICAVLREALSE